MPIYPYSFQLPPLNVQDIPNDGAPGEFLGINGSGQLDWLTAGGGGSGDMLKSENLSGLANYATARTNMGLGTADTPTFANLALTSPILTSSAPITFTQTWDNLAVAFTGLKVNAVSTASAAASKLLDLQLGGNKRFEFRKNGEFHVSDSNTANRNALVYIETIDRSVILKPNLNGGLTGPSYYTASAIGNSLRFQAIDPSATTHYFSLYDDSVINTLALRNGANAQTFRVYGAHPDTSNYARLALSCDTSGNATIATQALGTYTAGTVSINGVPVGLGKGNVATNVAIGTNALNANTTGSRNTVIGYESCISNTTGLANAVLGWNVLKATTFAEGNTAIGDRSLSNCTNSTYTTAIGQAAGFNISTNAFLTLIANSVLIGAGTKPLGDNETNQIIIGHSATGIGSNSVVLGNDSITKTALKGNVGIGTTAPSARLEVVATAATGVRESIFRASVSDNATSAFHIYNGSVVDGRFLPGFSGSVFDSVSPTLIFAGQTNSANDTGTVPLVFFSSRITSSTSDPNNGTITSVSTRPLFAWTNGATTHMQMAADGNLGIGTTAPTSKLHIAGTASPTITVENTQTTGYSQFLFKNTVVSGDGFWLNGSTQTGYGGASSFNLFASTGPLAFHTASVTNALSIAQSGAITYTTSLLSVSGSSAALGATGIERTYINQNGARIFGFDSGLFLLGAAFSSANPAIKRNGTSLQIRLADDSAFTSVEDLYRRVGANTPEGAVTAPVGAVFHRTDGGAGTSFYVKESGTGNTGWVAK